MKVVNVYNIITLRVTIIVMRNGISDSSSIHGRGCLCFAFTQQKKNKQKKTSISSLASNEKIGKTGFFNLD